jgi:hypothetical protein
MRVFEIVGFFQKRCQLGLLGVFAPETRQQRLAAEPGQVHRHIRRTARTLIALRMTQHRHRRFGGDPVHLTQNVPVQHQVANDQHLQLAETALQQSQNRMCFLQHVNPQPSSYPTARPAPLPSPHPP